MLKLSCYQRENVETYCKNEIMSKKQCSVYRVRCNLNPDPYSGTLLGPLDVSSSGRSVRIRIRTNDAKLICPMQGNVILNF